MFNKPVLVVMLVCMILLPVACNPSPPGLPSTQPNSNKPQNSKVIAPIPSSSQITERLAAKSKDGGAAKASEDEVDLEQLLFVPGVFFWRARVAADREECGLIKSYRAHLGRSPRGTALAKKSSSPSKHRAQNARNLLRLFADCTREVGAVATSCVPYGPINSAP